MEITVRTAKYVHLTDILFALKDDEDSREDLAEAIDKVSFGDATHTMVRATDLYLTPSVEGRIYDLIGHALIDLEN